MTETIQHAAVKIDGVITTGKSHSECIRQHFEAGRNPGSSGQGFVTSNGRFVNREEAAVIAYDANQIDSHRQGIGLISEMLWDARDGGKHNYDSKTGYILKDNDENN